MVKIEIEDTILLLAVSRKPNKLTGLDTVEIIKPTSVRDAIAINNALNHAQHTLLDLTKKALADAQVTLEPSR